MSVLTLVISHFVKCKGETEVFSSRKLWSISKLHSDLGKLLLFVSAIETTSYQIRLLCIATFHSLNPTSALLEKKTHGRKLYLLLVASGATYVVTVVSVARAAMHGFKFKLGSNLYQAKYGVISFLGGGKEVQKSKFLRMVWIFEIPWNFVSDYKQPTKRGRGLLKSSVTMNTLLQRTVLFASICSL